MATGTTAGKVSDGRSSSHDRRGGVTESTAPFSDRFTTPGDHLDALCDNPPVRPPHRPLTAASYSPEVRWAPVSALLLAVVAAVAPVGMPLRPVAVGRPIGTAAAQPACPDQLVPPGPPAKEELGKPVPDPLPVPAQPIGGDRLGCGEVAATGAPLPPVPAPSYVLADLDTGQILAAKAPHARERPASTLKVLNALVTLRDLDPDTVVDGLPEDLRVDGSKAGIGPGGHYTVRQLLGGLLLNSGNDTAEALARANGGDGAMLTKMTDLAHQLGAMDTRPVTPSGLDGPGMASSAYDLALMYRVAMRNPLFASTISTRSMPFPGYDDKHPEFTLYNSSKMLTGYPGSLGSKTGFTDAARHTLVTAAERGGHRLVVAIMRGEQQPETMVKQASALLDWGFAQPAGAAPVGVLVDKAPAPPTSATPAPADPATGAPQAPRPPAGSGTGLYTGFGVGAAAVLGTAFVLGLRRRRADPDPGAR
jgi:D-alanyl-D-alanine carboxypeptidase (penicillin-binding protein 5/6)